MSAYAIVQINVTNQENYKEYLKNVTPIVEKFRGEYIVRAGKFKVLLGNWDFTRTVIVRFPDYVTAMNWYNSKDYARIKDIRHKYADSNLVILKGLI